MQPIPRHLNSQYAGPTVYRPQVANRKNVVSVVRPTLADICRHEGKQAMNAGLKYHASGPEDAFDEKANPTRQIPRKDLFHTLDKQHEALKAWKDQLKKEVLPTTWSGEQRFKDPQLKYTHECATRS